MALTPAPAPLRPAVDLAALTGTAPQPADPVNMAERMRAVMSQIRELTMQIDALAQQFPDASEGFDLAKQGLIDGMKRIVANQGGPEPAAPAVFG